MDGFALSALSDLGELAFGSLVADPVLVVAFVLLLGGVVGSVAPVLPGGVLSLSGLVVYGLFGLDPPGWPLLVGLGVLAVVAVAVDWGAGALAAHAGGASPLTAGVAGLVGLLLFFVTGPVGTLVGVAATVFAIEFYRGETSRTSARSAGITAVGMVVSLGVQLALTLTVLAGFAIAVFLPGPLG